MIRVTCNDVGFACDHELAAENEAELLKTVTRHAADVHGRELDAHEVEQLRATIRAHVAGQAR